MLKIDPIEFFYNWPLYNPIQITNANIRQICENLLGNIQFDGYCPECKKETIMSGSGTNISDLADASLLKIYFKNFEGVFSRKLTCKRQSKECMHFYFQYTTVIPPVEKLKEILDRGERYETKYFIQKIGQIPSVADLALPEMQKYRKLLGKEYSRELFKGIGLAANGVGIGSFVYLRRIFESLIEDAHKLAQSKPDWNEAEYPSRTHERIETLKEYLPNFLIENSHLYSILSKGIHELSEDECNTYFPAVKRGITLILDEKIREEKKQQEIEEAKKELNLISSEIKNT